MNFIYKGELTIKKTIYCIVGPSGVGKTTVVDALAERYGLKVVESYTTRPKRSENETGHRFVTDKEFDALGDLCAYTEFNGYRYGLPAAMVDESDLYVIDPDGVRYLRKHYKGERQVYVIGLTLPVETLIARMRNRGDSEEKISSRLVNDREVFGKNCGGVCNVLFDIGNDTVDEVVKSVAKIIGVKEN